MTSERVGAGSIPALLRICQTVDAAMRMAEPSRVRRGCGGSARLDFRLRDAVRVGESSLRSMAGPAVGQCPSGPVHDDPVMMTGASATACRG